LLDPYQLRRRALAERLEPFEIGRLLVHVNQRRGFLSNRKADRKRKKENSAMLDEINSLAEDLRAAGASTLGDYLAGLQEQEPLTRVRGRHTRRDMFEQEFEAIWAAQQAHHPTLLTDQLKYGANGKQAYPCKPKALGNNDRLAKYGLHGLIFFQRAMYWPKSVVGRCELEPKRKRCPRADRQAQRFRLLQEVNNLRLLDPATAQERPLTSEQRTQLLDYLARSKERKFSEIRKKLGLLETQRFNLERGERDKLLGMPTDYRLAQKSLFGKGWWDRPDQEKNDIVRVLLDDHLPDAEKVRRATGEWGLTPEAAEQLLDAELPEGYARYSRKAIAKLLPSLERGLPLRAAEGMPSALHEAGYVHESTLAQQAYLPQPPELTNPLVRQALHEVRKVINCLIREYGKPGRLHIELAREIKGSAEQRQRVTSENRKRERKRDEAAAHIREAGFTVSADAINRYLLWKEQKGICIYSSRPITLAQLFGGEVDIDHILPRYRSLDNSQMNRVVCFQSENALKGDRTPHEWLAATDRPKYEQVLRRADDLDYPKARRFGQESVELTDFFARQFVDTAYITTQVREYVECLGCDVVCTKGQHTAELRRHWGLNTILRDDGLDLKTRKDHRHHAVDAVVIALTNRSRLQQLAALHKRGGVERTGEVLADPWPHFRQEVEQTINAVNVSHRVLRKIHGPLHDDTIYGPTAKPYDTHGGARPWAKDWLEEEGVYVYRKPLETLTLPEVERIRDTRVRELVRQRLAQFGIQSGRKKKAKGGDNAAEASNKSIPKEVWKDPLLLAPRMGSGGSPAVIKKVRLTKPEKSIVPIRQGTAYVKPGSLHHLCIFEFTDEKGKPKREAIFVSMLEAIQMVRQGQALIQRAHPERPQAKFIMSLSSGEMALATFKGKERLVCFNTAASTTGQLWFVAHNDARPSAEAEKFSAKATTLVGRKVTVDPLGRLRWAND
jgi:CRISPR-associated endonuclease Csn1